MHIDESFQVYLRIRLIIDKFYMYYTHKVEKKKVFNNAIFFIICIWLLITVLNINTWTLRPHRG